MKDVKTYYKDKLPMVDPRRGERGKIGIPLLLWIGGVPLTLVLILWLVFFRG